MRPACRSVSIKTQTIKHSSVHADSSLSQVLERANKLLALWVFKTGIRFSRCEFLLSNGFKVLRLACMQILFTGRGRRRKWTFLGSASFRKQGGTMQCDSETPRREFNCLHTQDCTLPTTTTTTICWYFWISNWRARISETFFGSHPPQWGSSEVIMILPTSGHLNLID